MSNDTAVRAEKAAVVDEVRERLSSTEAVVLTEYRGLDVPALAELRRALRDAGGEYRIYKNTLVRFAAKELDLDLEDLLTGPTAIAFVGERADGSAGDPVSLAKALREFAKDHEELLIKGGLLDGKRLGTEEIAALAKIAPREVLLAQLAGAMQAPMQQFAGLIKALPQNLAYALQALIDQSGAPGSPEAPAEAVADDAAADETEAVADDAAADETEAVADDAAAEETDAEADVPAEETEVADAAEAEETQVADAAEADDTEEE